MRNLNFLADLDAFTAQPDHFNKNVHRTIVPEGFYGLLYRHGQYRHRLSPGKHRFWRRGYDVRLVDMRKLTLTVAGQDVLTADNLNVKLSALVIYQVLQPEKALHDVQDYQAHFYNAAQLAIRSVVAGSTMD